MKKLFKLGCGALIALIILGAIIGALGGGDDSSKVDDQKSSATSTDKKPTKKMIKTKLLELVRL
ncbi:hypothetical protein [Lysinibacillus boronitolerans]|uniref:hypothetical protein n=1 Tax=Lysinibacillus boronitolerans TaxID=309788 RepID=UPI0003063D8A|nr:hypothetical protein [Lysinibacillus boronitolerans]